MASVSRPAIGSLYEKHVVFVFEDIVIKLREYALQIEDVWNLILDFPPRTRTFGRLVPLRDPDKTGQLSNPPISF